MNDTRKLDAALLAAQKEAPVLPQDGRNAHAGYRYTTAKTIIAIGMKLFIRHGLILDPHSVEVSDDKTLLHCEYILIHAGSSQQRRFRRSSAVHSHRGKEIDKAVNAADTSCYAYVIRRVLGLPDVEHEVDSFNEPDGEDANIPVPVLDPLPPKKKAGNAVQAMLLAKAKKVEVEREKIMDDLSDALEVSAKKVETCATDTESGRKLRKRITDLSFDFKKIGEEAGIPNEDRAKLFDVWAGTMVTGPHVKNPKLRMLVPDKINNEILTKIEQGFVEWRATMEVVSG